eukprot:11288220-Alexandrium_andersonii.AAC.1
MRSEAGRRPSCRNRAPHQPARALTMEARPQCRVPSSVETTQAAGGANLTQRIAPRKVETR